MAWLVVPAPGTWNDYAPMYALGFALSALWIARASRRRGWDVADTAALVLAVAVGALAGSKLLVSLVALGSLDPGTVLAASEGRTWLGGLLGGTAAGWLAARALGLRGATDAFAPVVPLALALGRLGCLLGGCCYGTPTEVPWGVAYAAGSDPWGLAVASGALSPTAPHTHALHPAPLYEIGAAAALGAFVWLTRDDRRWDGRRLAVVLAGYLVARFGVEWVRVGAEPVLGLEPGQWFALAVFPLALVVREPRAPRTVDGATAWAACAALGLAGWPLWGGVERLVLVGLLVATGLARIAAVARRPAVGLALAGAAVAALAADDPAEDDPTEEERLEAELLEEPPPPNWGRGPTHLASATPFVVAEGGGMGGSYVVPCGGRHRYTSGAVGIAYTEPLGPHADWTAGVRVAGGVDEEVGGASEVTWGVSPRLGLETRFVGAGAGFHVGRLVRDGEPIGAPLLRDRAIGALPSARLRLGPRDYAWLDAAFLQHDPWSFPGPMFEVGAGFALGKHHEDRWSTLRVGLSEHGFYASPDISLPGDFQLIPYAAFADANTWNVGLTVRYHVALAPLPFLE